MRPFPKLMRLVVLGSTYLHTVQAVAQITLAGPEIQVTTTTSASAYQGAPAVAWKPAGDYVVAWQQQSATTGGWDIFARQYHANGNALGPAFQVNAAGSTFCRQFPALATDDAGDFVVVWQSNEQSGGTFGIFGQLYNSAGQPGPQLHVNTTTTYDDEAPAVAMAHDGRFVVAWQRNGQDGSSWGIVSRAFAAGGAPASAEIAVNQTTAGAQHSPAVAYLSASAVAPERFELVWQVEGQDGAEVAPAAWTPHHWGGRGVHDAAETPSAVRT